MGINMEEMDAQVSLMTQMQSEDAPVVLINKFTAPKEQMEALLTAWTRDAQFMKEQPGFVSTQLHRGIAGSGVYINVAEWKSLTDFRAAFLHPEFQQRIADYPPGVVVSPHLFSKVAVAGICEGSE